MNKTDLIKSIAGKTGCKEIVCRQMVKAMMETMEEELDKGEGIVLQGFGSFRLWPQSPRMGRNPRTGAACPIAPPYKCQVQGRQGLAEKAE